MTEEQFYVVIGPALCWERLKEHNYTLGSSVRATILGKTMVMRSPGNPFLAISYSI